jgi:ferrous iron transport protein B
MSDDKPQQDKLRRRGKGRGSGNGGQTRFRRRGGSGMTGDEAVSSTACEFNAVLVGNPNTGKTTIYNALTGLRAKVGNYPGITVERRVGSCELGEIAINVHDVPGSYSLYARSAEEQVAIKSIIGLEGETLPDLVIVVVDGLNLERNLYLTLQIAEFELPMILAVNMLDSTREEGIHLHLDALSEALGIPVVGMAAARGQGIEELRQKIVEVLDNPEQARSKGFLWQPSEALAADLDEITTVAAETMNLPEKDSIRRAFALWLLMSVSEEDELQGIPDRVRQTIYKTYQRSREEQRDVDAETVRGRYRYIDRLAQSVIHRPVKKRLSRTDRIDGVLTHGLWGFLIFAGTMTLLFQVLFAWADPFISAIEHAMGFVGLGLATIVPAGLGQDFLVEGVLAGVGNVLVFLPQIVLMFVFITLLEDVGYMARAAFLIDNLMRRIGLNGKAFVPLISGFACAVPAIMAVRTIEDRRSRLITMLVIPLMTCSARLPVYSIIIAAFFPASEHFGPFNIGGLILLGAYFIGTAGTLISAGVLRRTVLPGKTPALLIELPPYRLPMLRNVGRVTYERAMAFIKQAGTIILVFTVILWGLLTFPRNPEYDTDYETLRVEAQNDDAELNRIDSLQTAERLEKSIAGRIGIALETVTKPLGFDWRINVGLIGAFAAREIFVSTLAVIFGISSDDETESESSLRDRLRNAKKPDGSPRYTPLFGLSLMIYFIFALQCFSTLAIIKRESGSWKWAFFAWFYAFGISYTFSLIIYQGGKLLGFA